MPPSAAKTKKVYADYFTSFHSREYSGKSSIWQYYHGTKVQWSGDLYSPPGSCRKETSTPYYPLIGTYDAKDTKVLEYHILMAKLAGLDGFFCEYALPTGHDAEVAETMARLAKRYHFQVGIHWITINFTQRTPGLKTRTDLLRAAERCLKRAFKTIYQVAGVFHKNRPVVLMFVLRSAAYAPGQIQNTHFSAEELIILKRIFSKTRPCFLTFAYEDNFLPAFTQAVDGYYPWMIPAGSPLPPHSPHDTFSTSSMQKKRLQTFYHQARQSRLAGGPALIWGGAWPGFDDHRGRAWGEDLARYIPREKGRTFQRTWQTSLDARMSTILIATWNDWVESSNLEPSVDLGYHDLELAQTNISTWKQIQLSPESLRWPIRLYYLRKKISQYHALRFPAKQVATLQYRADRIALTLSRFQWTQARKNILQLETECNTQWDTQIHTQNHVWTWSSHVKNPALRITGLHSTDQFRNLHINLTPNVSACLQNTLISGRLRFTFRGKRHTWFQILQTTHLQKHELANFGKKSGVKWDTVEVDILPRRIPKTGEAGYGFIISVTTPKERATFREVTLNVTTASRVTSVRARSIPRTD